MTDEQEEVDEVAVEDLPDWEESSPVLGADLQAKARRFYELRVKRDELKAALKAAEEEYRNDEQEFWDALDESPLLGAQKLDLGEPFGVVTFTPNQTTYGRIIDKEAALKNFGIEEMNTEMTELKISGAQLNTYVREKLDNAAGALGAGIDFTVRRYITVTKQNDE